jgi:hypothetical protein
MIDSHQMYWSPDHKQENKYIFKIRYNNIVHKRSTDQSLDLSFNKASEIKISIMSAQVDPPSSHIVLNQMGSISSKITRIRSWTITQIVSDHISI